MLPKLEKREEGKGEKSRRGTNFAIVQKAPDCVKTSNLEEVVEFNPNQKASKEFP